MASPYDSHVHSDPTSRRGFGQRYSIIRAREVERSAPFGVFPFMVRPAITKRLVAQEAAKATPLMCGALMQVAFYWLIGHVAGWHNPLTWIIVGGSFVMFTLVSSPVSRVGRFSVLNDFWHERRLRRNFYRPYQVCTISRLRGLHRMGRARAATYAGAGIGATEAVLFEHQELDNRPSDTELSLLSAFTRKTHV